MAQTPECGVEVVMCSRLIQVRPQRASQPGTAVGLLAKDNQASKKVASFTRGKRRQKSLIPKEAHIAQKVNAQLWHGTLDSPEYPCVAIRLPAAMTLQQNLSQCNRLLA